MSFINKSLFITLLSICTFQAYAAQCSAETFAKNKLNNFILVGQQTRTEIPKSVSITVESHDGYLRTSVQSNFSQCGELIGSRMKQVMTSTGPKAVFTATSEMQLDKEEFGWRLQLDSNGVTVDKNIQKPTQAYRQTLEGTFQLNDKGVITRAVNRSVIAAAKTGDKDKIAVSTIDYAFNASGLLESATSKGSMAIDNNTIIYSYDSNHRLIKSQSPSTIEEYGYDNEGRELTLNKTQAYFTIEKKMITCEQWNSHGECIRANIDITIAPIDRTGTPSVHKHNAIMTAKYEYWN